jgi:hypothetical protein
MQDGQIVYGIQGALNFIKVHLEYICVTCTVLAAFASIVAMKQFRRANQMSARLLELAEQKPLIKLSLYTLDDVKDFIVSAPLKKDQHLALPLVFAVTNAGEKTATDLQLAIRMSKLLCTAEYETSTGATTTFSRFDSENFSTFLYDFRSLNPNEAKVMHVDVLMPRKNMIDFTNSGFRVEAYYAFMISATIACKDTATRVTNFRIEFINTHDSNAAAVLNEINRQTNEKKTSALSFVRRMFEKPTEPLTKIALVDFTNNDLKHIGCDAPVDRIEKPTVHVVRGAKMNDDGSYFLPAIGVLPKGYSHSTPKATLHVGTDH